jgi:GTP-binding protein
VSNTPGRTQQLNFFKLSKNTSDERLRLVDMPGYGYAAVGKEKIANWSKLMRDYLRGRAELARVYVMIDGRRGVKPADEEMLDLLDQSAVSYQVILTKHDELTAAERNRVVEATITALAKRPAAYPEIIFTSSQSGEGIAALRESVARLLHEIGA